LTLSAVRCLLPAPAKCRECLSFHPQGTQHSLSSQRVKPDTCPSSVYRRRGIKASSPQPAPSRGQFATEQNMASQSYGEYCRSTSMPTNLTWKEQSLPPLVCVEPTHIPLAGILPARVLSRVESSTQEPSRVTSQQSH